MRSTGIVAAAGIVAGGLQYAFHAVIARRLTLDAYGDVNVLLSIMFMVGLPVGMVQTALAKSIAEIAARDRYDLARDVLRRSIRALLWPAAIAGGVLTVGSPLLTPLMRVESVWVVAVTGPVLSMLILLPVWRGAVQGLREFAALGLSQVVEGVARLVCCMPLLAWGAGAVGAMASSLAAIVAAIASTQPALSPLRKAERVGASAEFAALRRSLGTVSVALVCCAVISNVDVLIVKLSFASPDAAAYAAASVVARSVLYIAVAVNTVMLPIVAHETARERRARPVLAQSFLLGGLLCGMCILVLVVAAEPLVSMVLGSAYGTIAPLVRLYALAMLPMVPLNTLVNYELGCGRTAFLRLLVPAALAHVVALSVFHPSLQTVPLIVAGGGTVASLLLAAHMAWAARSYSSA